MINDLGLQIKHRTDIVAPIKLNGVIGSRQAVVALYATGRAVERHLSGPG